MKKKQIYALLLAGVLASGSMPAAAMAAENTEEYSEDVETAESAPEETAAETQAPETAAPETQTPETSAPETAAPETQTPETSAPETQTEKNDPVNPSALVKAASFSTTTDTFPESSVIVSLNTWSVETLITALSSGSAVSVSNASFRDWHAISFVSERIRIPVSS